MKNYYLLFLVFFVVNFNFVSARDRGFQTKDREIYWYSNYQEAVVEVKRSKKPMMMLFTDSNRCRWCKRFNNEILDDPEFISEVIDKFIFFKADFSSKKFVQEPIIDQNEKLKRKFQVTGYPTIVILGSNLKHVSTLGYLPIGGKKYAKNLNSILQEYVAISKTLLCPIDDGSNKVLEQCYEKAKKIGSQYFQKKLLKEGMKKNESFYFYLEKYKLLLEGGIAQKEELDDIREKIVQYDPFNNTKVHLHLAIVDFQYLAKFSSSEEVDKAALPLLNYIESYGQKDKENLWRLQMMIAQYFFSHGKILKALEHTRNSFKVSPLLVRRDLLETIKYLKEKL